MVAPSPPPPKKKKLGRVTLTTRNSIPNTFLDRELHFLSSFSGFFLVFNFCFILLHIERMNHMGNAFVACDVVYCIDSYNARSTTIKFAYDFKTGRTWNPTFSSPISTTTTPWWTTTPVKECCTPGTTIVWSLILSLLNHKSKKETAPKLTAFLSTENSRVQLKSGHTKRGVVASPISLS